MTEAVAQTLIAGQKIQYWDGRIATVTVPADQPVVGEVTISFDAATANPKPVHYIKTWDFMRAEPM